MHPLVPWTAAIALGFIAWLALRRSPRSIRIALTSAAVLAVWASTSFWMARTASVDPANPGAGAPSEQGEPSIELAQLAPLHPQEVSSDGYVSSETCQECHPDNHASWSASYHRTMTQLATPAAVFGDFNDSEYVLAGRKYQLRRRNGVCWVEMDEPNPPAGERPRIEVPIVMTTGSHHLQVYWYPTGEGRVVRQLPLVYLKELARWIPRDSSFLQPPSAFGAETGNWNQSCINCHTTHGKPRPDGQGAWDSQVGEFGISCEACHGPGERHVALHRASESVDPDADPIVNPLNLPHQQAAQVCGQCHGFTFDADDQEYQLAQRHGRRFRPGDELAETRHVLQTNDASRQFLTKYLGADAVDEYLLGQFWSDGMVRVTGREYTGLEETACFQQGELSCLSCHLLHKKDDARPAKDWADDQLHPGMRGDDACVQCHDAADFGSQHTHHASESAGSRCYNCHMPHTTYGLLKAIRSHKITSPKVLDEVQTGRPTACNLCHLDKTLQWTSTHLQEWYGTEKPVLDQDQETIAASLLTLLRGDAGQRALVAWNMTWQPALEASGNDWQAPFLACLLQDPYDAVRFIAHQSLQRLPGFDKLPYDFVGPEGGRELARNRVLQRWSSSRPTDSARHGPSLLIDPQSGLQIGEVNRLLSERDDRPVNLAE
jgi:hypothetical protein